MQFTFCLYGLISPLPINVLLSFIDFSVVPQYVSRFSRSFSSVSRPITKNTLFGSFCSANAHERARSTPLQSFLL